MAFEPHYADNEPARATVDALAAATLLEFGAPWCGYCIAAQAPLQAALAQRPQLRHLKIEDGRGRPLGRSFGVKLWPTLVLLWDGVERGRVVRPATRAELEQLLALLDPDAVA